MADSRIVEAACRPYDGTDDERNPDVGEQLMILARMLLCAAIVALHPYTVRDMYHLEELGDTAAFSPAGSDVAFVVKRPRETAHDAELSFLIDHDTADVYVGDLANGRIEKITDGVRDGSGFWDPQWSPDGTRIAMLSTRGGNVDLWVWDRASGLRRITDRAIVGLRPGANIVWLSNDRLLCEVLPAGQPALAMDVEAQTPRVATRAWRVQTQGRAATVSVLESGVSPDVTTRPQRELLLVDLTAGNVRSRVIAHAAQFDTVTLSPDRRYVAAFAEVGILEPKAGRKFQSGFDPGIYAPSVYDLRSGRRTATFDGVRDVGTSPLSWAWDGSAVAFEREPATSDHKSRVSVTRCTIATRACVNILPASLGVDTGPNGMKTAPLWSADGAVLVYAKNDPSSAGTCHYASCSTPAPSGSSSPAPGAAIRWDWYRLGGNGSTVNMTHALTAAPPSLVQGDDGSRFIGLADGKLTEVFPNGSAPASLPISAAPRLTGIVFPAAGERSRTLLVSAGTSDQGFFAVNLETNRSARVASVPARVAFNAFDPRTLSAIFVDQSRNGSFVRYAYRRGTLRTLYAANTWLTNVAAGRTEHFSYTSLDGQKLDGWILLPVGYQPHRRYPAVVWVYAGSVMNPRKPPMYLTDLTFVSPLNMQLLAARGYAVIFPSMPLPPFGTPQDPYPKLTNGVLPAIDEAVRLGYVENNRVALLGQSYGGFSTYGLITQTDRFKAAIALAGISDWASLYGTFDMRMRYGENVNEDQFGEVLIEDGQASFGDPPWVNPARYAANSPITYVDRVHTPLLIMQGDLDYVSMQQGEEFFTALYRQGKRAEFARYWGEDHVFRSEANVTDFWRRIYAWLGEFL
jgi:dipeptidyl aminopeptidase/acylaminoacyl peptidase